MERCKDWTSAALTASVPTAAFVDRNPCTVAADDDSRSGGQKTPERDFAICQNGKGDELGPPRP